MVFFWFSDWYPNVQKCAVLFSKRRISVHLVDLVKIFLASIYLQKSASIQPRTSLPKFAKKYQTVRIKARMNVEVDYRSWSKADLVTEARRRNLSATGNKQDLIDRLTAADEGSQDN